MGGNWFWVKGEKNTVDIVFDKLVISAVASIFERYLF